MSDENKFEPGDVVRIKSGGPAMTVIWQNSEQTVGCRWWHPQASKYEFDKFVPQMLYKSDKDQF